MLYNDIIAGVSLTDTVGTDSAQVVAPVIPLGAATHESTYAVASGLLDIVHAVLKPVGLGNSDTAETVAYAIVVFLVAMLVGVVTKWIVLKLIDCFKPKTQQTLFGFLSQEGFFVKIVKVIPAFVFLILIQFTLVTLQGHVAEWLTKLTWLYVLFVTAQAISALIGGVWRNVDSRKNKRHLPLNGLVQLLKGILWIIVIIIAVAVLVNRSPTTLLAGLGAFAAVLMLVFRDSILGVVAGVQLSENDSLHVGDWIKIPGTDANGTVTEVTLTSVSVLNWDKTTTHVPPYSLVSGSFTNMRSMQVSKTRRICRSIIIDSDTIAPTTPELLAKIRKVPFMAAYITAKLAQKAAGRTVDVDNPDGLVDGTIETNIGLLRAYVKMYLDASPLVSHSDTCFVSLLEQQPSGVPLQVYCFTSTSSWLPYEAMMDTIFEHIMSMLRHFNLSPFKNPSGRDTILEGYVGNHDTDDIFALPRPWLMDTPMEVPSTASIQSDAPETGTKDESDKVPAKDQGGNPSK